MIPTFSGTCESVAFHLLVQILASLVLWCLFLLAFLAKIGISDYLVDALANDETCSLHENVCDVKCKIRLGLLFSAAIYTNFKT